MEDEIRLGHHLRDVSGEYLGYDIGSLAPKDGRLRFIEVKGRRAGARTVTVTKNELLTGINSAAPNTGASQVILALVEVAHGGEPREPHYVRKPFGKEPDFGAESVDYKLRGLLDRSAEPA